MSGKKVSLFVCILILAVASLAYAADCNNGGRYEINGYPFADGTITDCRTGLIWLQNTNCTVSLGLTGIDKSAGTLNWQDAMKWVAALGDGYCGLMDGSGAGDWRLPTKTEWMAMVAYAKGRYTDPALTNAAGTLKWTANSDAFNNVQSYGYWSSATEVSATYLAWFVSMNDGRVDTSYKSNNYYVWPVRGGQSGTFGDLTVQ